MQISKRLNSVLSIAVAAALASPTAFAYNQTDAVVLQIVVNRHAAAIGRVLL